MTQVKHYSEIQGWFGYEKQFDKIIMEIKDRRLFSSAKPQEKPPVVVEIGSWLGRSSFYLVNKYAIFADIYVVDTWQGSESELHSSHKLVQEKDIYIEFMRNMRAVHGRFTPVRTTSTNAANIFEDGSVDFVFIDAEHTYEAVLADIKAWVPKLSPSAIIAGHDYDNNWPGVKKAVQEMFGLEHIREENSCWMIYNPHEALINLLKSETK